MPFRFALDIENKKQEFDIDCDRKLCEVLTKLHREGYEGNAIVESFDRVCNEVYKKEEVIEKLKDVGKRHFENVEKELEEQNRLKELYAEKVKELKEENENLKEEVKRCGGKQHEWIDEEELEELKGFKLCLEEATDLLLQWKDNMLPFIELGEKIKARGKKQLEDPIANQYGVCFDTHLKTGVKTKRLLDFMADNEILGVWKEVKKED